MRNRKAAALGCTALLITAMMTGCAAKGNDSLAVTSQVSESTARTTTENTQNGKTDESSQAEKGEQETGTQYGSVTAVDGNKITADLGTLDTAMPGGEEPNGDKPEGEAPSGDKPEGEAPSGDKPEGKRQAEIIQTEKHLAEISRKEMRRVRCPAEMADSVEAHLLHQVKVLHSM